VDAFNIGRIKVEVTASQPSSSSTFTMLSQTFNPWPSMAVPSGGLYPTSEWYQEHRV